MLYSTLSSLLFAAIASGAAISVPEGTLESKRDGFVGCYNVHNNPDWMKKSEFTRGIDTICDGWRNIVLTPGQVLSRSLPGFVLEDNRDAFFVGSYRNTGAFDHTFDYDYCRQKMGTIRESCSGAHDDTYGGEWHDTVYVTADTNAA
ncbi:hypothetical protein V494_07425 [Pseudogymnoascus sp. VKM F-4513 (FW-928)]|nr:hypothetical protein V494_07425 [Pseudogymnoascus sp. VKM F-4513 (FW-928)]